MTLDARGMRNSYRLASLVRDAKYVRSPRDRTNREMRLRECFVEVIWLFHDFQLSAPVERADPLVDPLVACAAQQF